MGHLKMVPQQQQQEEEQRFPLPDLSAAPQIKRAKTKCTWSSSSSEELIFSREARRWGLAASAWGLSATAATAAWE